MTLRLAPATLLLLAACGSQATGDLPGGDGTQPYAGLPAADTLHFAGTEPFWGGEVSGTRLRFAEPDDQQGTIVPVTRFAGRGGVSFSGKLAGADFTLLASEAPCSDGMSDRTYPFTVTVEAGERLLAGCGWSEHRPYTGAEAP